jgi:hypothetical protein
MKQIAIVPLVFGLLAAALAQRPPQPPPVQPTAAEKRLMQSKLDELDGLIRTLKARNVDEALVGDVEVYAKAARWLLEFPEDFFTQDSINHCLAVLDAGASRARELQNGRSPWMNTQRRSHAYYSALDGSVQPYGVTVPDSYDGSQPTRLYVWLHGRAARLTESEFLFAFPNQGPSKPPVANNGQIQLDVYGRWNGAGYHFAGEADVFEAIAAVQKRYKIDPNRILLRGFSMGGEGAWHIALHYPDRWAAAEIGAGTWSRRQQMPGLTPYQQATLRIWENYTEWALNVFNLPLAAHDGDHDTQVCCLPPPAPGAPTRGQLESSIKVREQLASEGFPSEGEPGFLAAKGTPAIFLISQNTGHGTSPLVREQLDSFLKKYGDRGRVSPDHIRFMTYTTRYNRDYWVSLDRLQQHYERAEVDASRLDAGQRYEITTKNVTRLTLRETGHARSAKIDGQQLRLKPASEIVLEKGGSGWSVGHPGAAKDLHKVHGLQGPIDDAFLDPFLLVRPTGTPWNPAVNEQVLRTLARFDRLYARFFRAHPRVIDDKDVTAADLAKYNIVLFGDPGSNRWIAKVAAKLPLRWTRESIAIGQQNFPASASFPAMVYVNPLSPSHYVVLNTGLTIDDREYRGDYGMPRLGDFAILKVKDGADVGEPVYAGLFDESWTLPAAITHR